MKKVLLVALAAAVSLPLLALARHVELTDPDDTKGLLDIRRVTVAGSRRAPTWTIATGARWTAEQMWDTGFLVVKIDTFGTRRADYYAIVNSDGRKFHGSLYRDRKKKPDRRLRGVRVDRADRRSLTIRIGLRELRRRESRIYRWYATTLFASDNCRSTCIDRAPDQGAISEPEPAQTPTPTPSVPTP
ncbi:MAG: hypothetical protein ACRDKT_02370 [Actinomycetota bacterium]